MRNDLMEKLFATMCGNEVMHGAVEMENSAEGNLTGKVLL